MRKHAEHRQGCRISRRPFHLLYVLYVQYIPTCRIRTCSASLYLRTRGYTSYFKQQGGVKEGTASSAHRGGISLDGRTNSVGFLAVPTVLSRQSVSSEPRRAHERTL